MFISQEPNISVKILAACTNIRNILYQSAEELGKSETKFLVQPETFYMVQIRTLCLTVEPFYNHVRKPLIQSGSFFLSQKAFTSVWNLVLHIVTFYLRPKACMFFRQSKILHLKVKNQEFHTSVKTFYYSLWSSKKNVRWTGWRESSKFGRMCLFLPVKGQPCGRRRWKIGKILRMLVLFMEPF